MVLPKQTRRMSEAVVELRRKNQITWPLAKEMGLHEGARLVVVYDPERDEAHVRPIRDSYAGSLRGVYGSGDDEIAEYVKAERGAWE